MVNSLDYSKEIWKPIKNFKGYYEISNFGRVKSLMGWNGHKHFRREKILKNTQKKYTDDYSITVVTLRKNGYKKTVRVHRLVAETFLKKIDGKNVVNHKDSNPLNNNVENLEWVTTYENVQHSIKNYNMLTKINTIDKETLLKLLNSGRTYKEISKILNVSVGSIHNYKNLFNINRIYV